MHVQYIATPGQWCFFDFFQTHDFNSSSPAEVHIVRFRWQMCLKHQLCSPNTDKSDTNDSFKAWSVLAFKNGVQSVSLYPLWPSDTIWRQRSGSTLAQVMACCLTAPSHYLNQCCSWMLTDHQWSPVTFILGQFHKRCLNHRSLESVSKLHV